MQVPGVDELTEGDPRGVVTTTPYSRLAPPRPASGSLGVDTAVVLEGRIFGKPRDAAEAASFLRALSGRTHEVMSGIALRRGRRQRDVPRWRSPGCGCGRWIAA